MIGRTARAWPAVAGLMLCAACGTDVTLASVALSGAGESCEAPSDCEDGLSCVDMVCSTSPSAAPSPTADGGRPLPVSAPTRSAAGESCARHADCVEPLSCFERVCRIDDTPVVVEGPRKGTRGESCAASNDCERGLGCIGRVCKSRDLSVPRAENECHRVECVEADDCCKDFSPDDPMLCTELEQGCQDGARADCNLHASLCTCRQTCEDTVCVADVACASDTDCGGSGVLRCFAGKCAQCASDVDCTGSSACVGGLCRGGCDRNEQCPIFSVCEGHKCEHVGCQSDRECFFVSDNPQSRCVDGECRTPCQIDSSCTTEFHACVDGLCTFVGCESDDECRAALALANQAVSDPVRAACRPPVE